MSASDQYVYSLIDEIRARQRSGFILGEIAYQLVLPREIVDLAIRKWLFR